MTNEPGSIPESDDQLLDFGPPLQHYLAGDPHALEALPPRERTLAEQLAPILQAARLSLDTATGGTAAALQPTAHPSAPRDHTRDPIAIALGLVPGPDDVLNAARFKNTRMHRGLNIKDVAERLSARGWHIEVHRVLRWQRTDTQLAPALIQAIAETLDADASRLRGRTQTDKSSSATAWLDDDTIADFLTDWARERGVDTDTVRAHAHQTLASMAYRNQSAATRDDVLAVLRALRRLDAPEA